MVDFYKHLKRNSKGNMAAKQPIKGLKRIYCDTETTSTNSRLGAIHQFTAIVTIDGKRVDHIDLRIKPHKDALIEESALEAAHVTFDQITGPDYMEPEDAFKLILGFLGKHVDKYNKKDKFFFVGYNGKFDWDYIFEFFQRQGDVYCGSWWWYPPLDVASLAGYLLQKSRASFENFKLRTVWEHLHPEEKSKYSDTDWHDSLFDVERTMDVENALRRIVTTARKPLWIAAVIQRLEQLNKMLPQGSETAAGMPELIEMVTKYHNTGETK